MKVSVVVAVYNCERYIGRAIRSLISQSFPRNDYEIIVIDDASTDHTRDVLQSFGDWVKVIELNEHRGLPFACNTGIRKALGRYVVRVDADDYVHEDLLRTGYLFLSLNDRYDAVSCDYYVVDERERIVERKNAETDPIACGVMFKKDNLVSVGLYDENFLMLEDADLRIRYLKNGYQICRIELPLYRYRVHDSNLSKNAKEIGYYQKLLKKKHKDCDNKHSLNSFNFAPEPTDR